MFLQKLCAAFLIAIHHGVGMVPHCGGGNLLVDGCSSGKIDGLRLGGAGNGAEHMLCLHQSGYSQRKGVGRNVVKGGEASVVDLLVAADLVQRNQLHQLGIVEVCDPGVVKGDMGVLADAQEDDIRGILGKQLGIAEALGLGILGGAVDIVHLAEGKLAENVVVKVSTEALGTFFTEAHVLVHVEGTDTGPIDPLLCQQGGKHMERETRRGCCRI